MLLFPKFNQWSCNLSDTDSKKSNLTREAVDFVYDERRKKYLKVTVLYNINTKEAQVKKVETISDSKPTAIHLAKAVVVNKVFFSNIDNPQEQKAIEAIESETKEGEA